MAGEATLEMAERAIRRLRSAGHEALLAGGCVRDMLLGRRPADYDVATSATPRQVKRLFPHVLMVGAKFGVAMVIENRRRLEITTFRCDVSYSDGRRPDAVRFVSAREDAQRRDFTINGMFYDPRKRRVVDYVGGRQDLQRRVIRAIGEPARRFAEDYLRMLRAVRFARRFDFEVDPATAEAIRRHAGRIVQISGERVLDELGKMLAQPSATRAVEQLHELGLLQPILPELFGDSDLLPRALRRLNQVGDRGDMLLSLAALLAGLDAHPLRARARRWGASNEVRDGLVWIAAHLDDWQKLQQASLAELKRLLAHPQFERLATLWRAEEIIATGKDTGCRGIRRRLSQIAPARVSPEPLVTGSDLKKLGLSEGPLLGSVLHALHEAQLNEQVLTRRDALHLARELIAHHRK